jgi:hypothetical protein
VQGGTRCCSMVMRRSQVFKIVLVALKGGTVVE